MAWKRGDRIAGRWILDRPLLGDGADRWLAHAEDGSLWVARRGWTPPAWNDAGLHPSLVGWQRADGDWLTRPWIDGAASARGLEPARALAAGRRLAEALAALHDAGHTHGNLRASNVFIDAATGLKLVDATGAGSAAEDLAAAAGLIEHWLERPPAVLGEILAAARRGAIDAHELRDRLDDVRLAGDRLRSEAAAISVSPAPPAPSPGPTAGLSRSAIIGLSLAGALLLVIAVLALLPDPAPSTAPPVVDRAPVAQPEVPEARAPTAEELEQLLERRQRAQNALDGFVALRLDLEARAVDRWGAEAFEKALELAESGNEPFRLQAFEDAEERYAKARDALQALADEGDRILAQALADGAQALADGRSDDAVAAFDLALAIDAEQGEALAGMERARSLDEALALLDGARAAEEAGQLEEARRLFEALAELDPAMPELAGAVARIDARSADRAFREAMSEGLAAMEIQDWAGARARFEEAARIRPGDPAPAEFIAEAERRARDFVLASHRRKAQEAVEQERWADAVRHYQAVLKREPNARVASEGLALAESRRDLYGALRQAIANPAAWWSKDGRARARELLARADAVDSRGPTLERLRAGLDEQLQLASRPVVVTLRSDNACNVVVYRVARLGSFDERRLELTPGRYTAVATRDGYRDVRKEFLVPAGGSPDPVELRCEEPV